MKIGIYLSGLGEAFTHETLEKYANRFARQYDFENPVEKATYQVHTERFEYDPQHQLISNRVTIVEKVDGASANVCVFYEYVYADALTKQFKAKNALLKTWLLFLGVCGKFPILLRNLIKTGGRVGYSARFRAQAFYLFTLFLVVSFAVLILLPAAFAVLFDIIKHDNILNKWITELHLNLHGLKVFAKALPSFIALLLLLMPGFNDAIVSLACEFVSASNYLQHGETKQNIHGQIDLLIEKIIEKEGVDCELYFHSYSFGSLICIDYLFPYGVEPSVRLKKHFKGLITIGSPVDFVAVYFPRFFKGRHASLVSENAWINVYSLADALGSNFRKGNNAGSAEYSIQKDAAKPINLNYEVANVDMNLFMQFVSLSALKAHGNYWDKEDNGQSCLRTVIPKMKELNFI